MRNYKSEYEWEKTKYKVFRIKVEKKLGDDFKNQLDKNKIKLVDWFRQNIDEYMQNSRE